METAAQQSQNIEKNVTDYVLNRVKELAQGGLVKLPKDYSAENALKMAWFELLEVEARDRKPALLTCSRESIANALLKMVVSGLTPAKKQCYFIAYGSKLNLFTSYFGDVALAKRYGGVNDVKGRAVYKEDEFDFEIDHKTGYMKLLKHKPTIASMNGEMIGAYAFITLSDGESCIEFMPMEQIKKSWSKSKTNESATHKNFSEEMAKRTVIRRACKLFINSSSDAALFEDFINEPADANTITDNAVREEISENANKELIELKPEPPVETDIPQAAEPVSNNEADAGF